MTYTARAYRTEQSVPEFADGFACPEDVARWGIRYRRMWPDAIIDVLDMDNEGAVVMSLLPREG